MKQCHLLVWYHLHWHKYESHWYATGSKLEKDPEVGNMTNITLQCFQYENNLNYRIWSSQSRHVIAIYDVIRFHMNTYSSIFLNSALHHYSQNIIRKNVSGKTVKDTSVMHLKHCTCFNQVEYVYQLLQYLVLGDGCQLMKKKRKKKRSFIPFSHAALWKGCACRHCRPADFLKPCQMWYFNNSTTESTQLQRHPTDICSNV